MSTLGRGRQPGGTHLVENQPDWRVDVDEYAMNTALREAVATFGAGWADEGLGEVGRLVGGEAFQRDAQLAHQHPPVAHVFDRWGFRLDEVEYDESYHRIIAAAVARGAHTSAWAQPRPGAAVARAATFMLFAQVEPGHACPISMTHAAVAPLAEAPWLADEWLPRLFARTYEPRLLAPERKPSALVGMAMTEKQGGSDVRANTTTGVHVSGHSYQLTGHKWFCSAPMSDAFLVLAQTRRGSTQEGLSCLLVPRVMPHGERNVFRVQRLKDKVGNRSNASAEIEFDGTVGVLVGEPGRGVRTIIEMVARTRLDCVLGTAAGMRQAVAEAVWHARGRRAFGRTLVDQPAMTAVLADLALEAEAATLLGLRLACAYEADATDDQIAFRRIATPVAKYWVCKRGPQHAYEAMECLGGNGYIESFPLGRRFREQPVMAIWEGSGNVIALDVLRALARDTDSVAALHAELDAARGAHPLLDAHLRRTLALLHEVSQEGVDQAQGQARRLTEALALALQGGVMARFAPTAAADAFLGARLGEDRGWQYGQLPAGTDAAVLLARH